VLFVLFVVLYLGLWALNKHKYFFAVFLCVSVAPYEKFVLLILCNLVVPIYFIYVSIKNKSKTIIE